eukprot:CAMPEP_0182601488 /NCGR_PEP_ID=MMETSP1324-20130603/91503_1 /TAXON_ID=236786 /ORGANISM="Florenciella sp., Strain RCC1587" /LENGTH=143 /DNA_ID=CAMNT_0024819399 /DNA_START=405 /DNA_END=834 /DNA_ORIENTATION=-
MEDQGVLIRSLGSKRALASLSTPNDADTKAPTPSAHHNRFGPELPWHHVLHLSPRDGPTHHIDLRKSPQTPTFAHSQIRTFLARFYMNALLSTPNDADTKALRDGHNSAIFGAMDLQPTTMKRRSLRLIRTSPSNPESSGQSW